MDTKSIAKMLVDQDEPEFDLDHFEHDEDSEVDEGLEVAAEEMMAAFEAKDTKSFAAALKSFLRMC